MDSGGDRVTLAEALDAERVRLGLSVNELAKRAGMRPAAVHDLTTGKTSNPGIATVEKVLAVLGKNLAWLERKTKH